MLKKCLKWFVLLLGIGLLLFWCFRVWASRQAPSLALWHKYVPREMTVAEMNRATWQQYLEHEERLFRAVRENVTDRLPESERKPGNRYYEGSTVYAPHFEYDWNRSYILEPEGKPLGVVVLLHGLTDSPYSLRHVAALYRSRGFLTLGIRLPGHGTVPGALTRVRWEEWMAATRLAVREARTRVPASVPLHIVGYSNGATLAMKYALDALEDSDLAQPDRLVFLSPMIGITRYARYVGLAAIPALLPPFAKTAWLNILPEYNPYKYNSFPVNGPRQSYRITRALQDQILRMAKNEAFLELPPILSFQSLVDHTVSTSAVFRHLYANLPENGSEIVLFDINRATDLTPLLHESAAVDLANVLPPRPLHYNLTIVANIWRDGAYASGTVAATTPSGRTEEVRRPLNADYPADIFSLSHIALPFPPNDELYGYDVRGEAGPVSGVNLGSLTARGERGLLVVGMDVLFRTMSNPFYTYMMERIEEGIDDPDPDPAVRPTPGGSPGRGDYDEDVEQFLEQEEEEPEGELP